MYEVPDEISNALTSFSDLHEPQERFEANRSVIGMT